MQRLVSSDRLSLTLHRLQMGNWPVLEITSVEALHPATPPSIMGIDRLHVGKYLG